MRLDRYFYILCAIVILKAFALGWYITAGELPLAPDEAQYWTWSQQLDWGYYSKPPAIAWMIWLGTHLFGNNELGVRFGSILIGSMIPLAVYGLTLSAGASALAAFAAGLIFAFTPLGILGTLIATTDGGMVLFWTLSCAVIAKAFRDGEPPDYIRLGLFILCGALFKWPAYYMWGVVAVLLPFNRKWITVSLLVGLLISVVGILPSAIWNYGHDWATFRHVEATIAGGSMKEVRAKGNFWEFFGGQFAFFSPILFLLLLVAFVLLVTRRKELPAAVKFCGWLSLAIIGIHALLALKQKIQGNWAVYAYPSAMAFLCCTYFDYAKKGRKWVWAGFLFSILFCALALYLPFSGMPYRFNPFKSNLGGPALEGILQDAGYDPSKHFLAGDKYQTVSLLSFYGKEQKRAYFFNIYGLRKNQFSYWEPLSVGHTGGDGYFISIRDGSGGDVGKVRKKISPYFEKVQFIGEKPLLVQKGKVVKSALVFFCTGYNGQSPLNPELY